MTPTSKIVEVLTANKSYSLSDGQRFEVSSTGKSITIWQTMNGLDYFVHRITGITFVLYENSTAYEQL